MAPLSHFVPWFSGEEDFSHSLPSPCHPPVTVPHPPSFKAAGTQDSFKLR